jgi:hypothetical protein
MLEIEVTKTISNYWYRINIDAARVRTLRGVLERDTPEILADQIMKETGIRVDRNQLVEAIAKALYLGISYTRKAEVNTSYSVTIPLNQRGIESFL